MNIIFQLTARNLGNEHVVWGRRFVSCSHKSRQHDCSDQFVSWFPPRPEPTEFFCGRNLQGPRSGCAFVSFGGG
jgi:hypothetical protein